MCQEPFFVSFCLCIFRGCSGVGKGEGGKHVVTEESKCVRIYWVERYQSEGGGDM